MSSFNVVSFPRKRNSKPRLVRPSWDTRFRGYRKHTTFSPGSAAAIVFETVRLVAPPLMTPLQQEAGRGGADRRDFAAADEMAFRALTEPRLAVPSPRLWQGEGSG